MEDTTITIDIKVLLTRKRTLEEELAGLNATLELIKSAKVASTRPVSTPIKTKSKSFTAGHRRLVALHLRPHRGARRRSSG